MNNSLNESLGSFLCHSESVEESQQVFKIILVKLEMKSQQEL